MFGPAILFFIGALAIQETFWNPTTRSTHVSNHSDWCVLSISQEMSSIIQNMYCWVNSDDSSDVIYYSIKTIKMTKTRIKEDTESSRLSRIVKMKLLVVLRKVILNIRYNYREVLEWKFIQIQPSRLTKQMKGRWSWTMTHILRVIDYDSYCPDFTWKLYIIASSTTKSTKTVQLSMCKNGKLEKLPQFIPINNKSKTIRVGQMKNRLNILFNFAAQDFDNNVSMTHGLWIMMTHCKLFSCTLMH